MQIQFIIILTFEGRDVMCMMLLSRGECPNVVDLMETFTIENRTLAIMTMLALHELCCCH